MRWVQAIGMPFVEAGGDPVVVVGPVHVVLDVFLAGPDDLDRAVDLLRDLDRLHDEVDLEPAAEAAAQQMVVHATFSGGRPATFAAAPGRGATTWVPTQTSQPSCRTWTVQFIGSIVACARNGTS